MRKPIWECTVGCLRELPTEDGCDLPMRMAVRDAYLSVTGVHPDFVFSGWNCDLTEGQLAVVENREPRPECMDPETRRANAAEAELREVAGELEKAKACITDLNECFRVAISDGAQKDLRLTEATALLELARDAIDEACYPVWWEQWRAFLSATPSPPAEPAPAQVRIVERWHNGEHTVVPAEPALCPECDDPLDADHSVPCLPCHDRPEPAPSLLEQIEAVMKAFDERKPLPPMSKVATAVLGLSQCLDTIDAIRDLLRAAREAGVR